MVYILLLIGLALLISGGDLLVRGGVGLANRYQVSPLVVGLTIVSLGTSAPELFASIIAGVQNHPDIAIGNVVGSNIANVALVLALTAMVIPIPVKRNTIRIDTPFMLLVSLLLFLFLSNLYLSRFEGIVFIVLIIGYTFGLFYYSKKQHVTDKEYKTQEQLAIGKIVIFLISSIGMLALGSYLLVENASSIAINLGIDERVVAVTMVAFGTSLPELVTSLVAAFKKEMDISVGNIVGSNIFNILVVLGITSCIKPLQVNPGFLKADIYWMLGISGLLFLFILPFRGGKLTRIKGAVLFLIYCVYIYILYSQKA